MCIFLYYINPAAKSDEIYLVLVNIRDEMYDRPTLAAHFWNNHPHVIGGLDAERGKAGGTWFAVSQDGKIGALLNVLQPDEEIAANKKGRGFLVTDYVTGNEDCYEYLRKISAEKDNYNGFTLVTMDISDMKSPKVAYFSNISSSTPKIIDSTVPGNYAFGNSTSVEHPWPKVMKAQEKFRKIVREYAHTKSKSGLLSRLNTLVNNRNCTSVDENMEQQGRGKTPEFLNKLSCICVHMPEYNYGSRSHTIVMIDGSGKVHYHERHRLSHDISTWRSRNFDFELDSFGDVSD